LAARVLLKIVNVLTSRILGLLVVLFRGDQAAAEVLVLRPAEDPAGQVGEHHATALVAPVVR
jgi:hypothetical protein